MDIEDRDPSHMTDQEIVDHLCDLKREQGYTAGRWWLDRSEEQENLDFRVAIWRRDRIELLRTNLMERLKRVEAKGSETE